MDLSGHERDKLYLSRGAQSFAELSYLSGADGVEDARAFALADLDRDGHEDLIVVNRNAPLLRVYHNRIGPSAKQRFVGVSLEGAADGKLPPALRHGSNRDAVGARVTARCGALKVTRELALGTGFATVNAHALTINLGDCKKLDELSVRFPSGERRSFQNLLLDHFYRVVEGKGAKEVPAIYARPAPAAASAALPIANARSDGGQALAASLERLLAAPPSRPQLVTYWATWCEACKRAQPRVDALGALFADRLDVVGVSVEPKDNLQAVDAYRAAEKPAHRLLAFDAAAAQATEALFGGKTPPLPSTVLLGANGKILLRTAGVPSRSEIERALFRPGHE